MLEIPTLPDANVRSRTFYVARTDGRCWHCGVSTRLLALAMPNNHETALPDAEAEGDDRGELTPVAWQRADANAFLFYVEYMPDGVRDRLKRLSQSFRFAYSTVTLNSYWANHCEHCGTLLEDHELHCEPDGAFLPSSEAAAAAVQLQQFEEPFEAAAAGYSLEPEFFSSMRRT